MSAEPQPREVGLEQAYSLASPSDSRELYAAWADSYDADFVAAKGYRYHEAVAAIFARDFEGDGAVLDIGCGTGLVGLELRRRQVSPVDGIDISPEMLAEAAGKRYADQAVYRTLVEADLTEPLPIAAGRYSGLVSAGTFTHGHLPPEPLAALVRTCRPGGRAVIGVNAAHYADLGFNRWFDEAEAEGRIVDRTVERVPVYVGSRTENLDEMANVVVFTVVQ